MYPISDPMQSDKRGILIIVNNINFRNKCRRRNGAEIDRDNLVHVFRQMGFFICVQEDLTKYVSFSYMLCDCLNKNKMHLYFTGIFGFY